MDASRFSLLPPALLLSYFVSSRSHHHSFALTLLLSSFLTLGELLYDYLLLLVARREPRNRCRCRTQERYGL